MFEFFVMIAAISAFCAARMTLGYYMKQYLPFNKDQVDMECFGAKDPKFDDGFDDDFDKKQAEFEREYFDN